jgi:hypothetical protein
VKWIQAPFEQRFGIDIPEVEVAVEPPEVDQQLQLPL